MNILVFDVETTGLFPKNETSMDKLPYVIQLSYAVYNTRKKKIIKTYDAYIDIPKEVEIPEKIVKLTGINRELLQEKGVSIMEAIEELYTEYCNCDVIVAHNLEFDSKCIMLEAKRNRGKFAKEDIDRYIPYMFNAKHSMMMNIMMRCTMLMSVDICNIEKENSMGKYKKYPTLCELYETLFHTTPDGLHNSMTDVLVCMRCYLKLGHNIDYIPPNI